MNKCNFKNKFITTLRNETKFTGYSSEKNLTPEAKRQIIAILEYVTDIRFLNFQEYELLSCADSTASILYGSWKIQNRKRRFTHHKVSYCSSALVERIRQYMAVRSCETPMILQIKSIKS